MEFSETVCLSLHCYRYCHDCQCVIRFFVFLNGVINTSRPEIRDLPAKKCMQTFLYSYMVSMPLEKMQPYS